MARMCAGCGTQVRGRRRCTACQVTDRHGQGIGEVEQAREQPDETMTIECGDCGLISEVGRDEHKTPCPECGHHGYRPVEVAQ